MAETKPTKEDFEAVLYRIERHLNNSGVYYLSESGEDAVILAALRLAVASAQEDQMGDALVYCVICIDDDGFGGIEREFTHIFSSPDRRAAYVARTNHSRCIHYDYLIDHPERTEGKSDA